MEYDLLIVGSGFAGAVIGYLSATRLGKKVLILEKRDHIGGNAYDEPDSETGILIQRYGPHIFVSDSERVYRFVTELGDWVPYTLRGRALIDGQYTPVPFNFHTVEQFFPADEALDIKTHLVSCFSYAQSVPITELMRCEDTVVRRYAEFLLEKDYRPYIAKQWGLKPEELDAGVIGRIPVRLTYHDQYFDKRFQMQPKGGYTAFFHRLLDQPGIDVALQTDALELLRPEPKSGTIFYCGKPLDIPLVYTGPLDTLFDEKFGRLPYRSRTFEYQTLDTDSVQTAAVQVYPSGERYIRSTEFKKLYPFQQLSDKSLVALEYSEPYDPDHGKEAYYPTLTDESKLMYQRYQELAGELRQFYPCGRLAEFRYYNMDDVIDRAISVCEKIWGVKLP